ncbi:MauE/DoxX family redox-associated membrane protein [Bacillus sp. SCS-151]|uniref:MauE/DoxX family redox-associated membrane protein n=1 Tax=Nanhaiella sioensis TaxID=3115293 RepID=UPI00397C9728
MAYLGFIQLFIATIFFISSLSKWINLGEFRTTMKELKIPKVLIPFGVIGIPLAELIVSASFVLDRFTFAAELLLFALLISFGWSVFRARGKHLKCNCFGSLSEEEFGRKTVGRILVFFILGLILFLNRNTQHLATFTFEEFFISIIASLGIFAAYLIASVLYQYNQSSIKIN